MLLIIKFKEIINKVIYFNNKKKYFIKYYCKLIKAKKLILVLINFILKKSK